MTLDRKVVIVTGGGGLLGAAFCRAIASNGGIAIVTDKDAARASTVARAIHSEFGGSRAESFPVDINDKASIDGMLRSVSEKHGRLDALVNNAYPRNRNYGRKFEEVEFADFCDNVGMHLGGYFLMAQACAAYFRRQGHGNIVNMASVYGFVAPRFEIYAGTSMTMPVEYAVIKAGVLQLTRYLASYFKGSGIRANALSPGGIADAQPPDFIEAYGEYCASKGMLDKGDVCGAMVFLLSDESRFINGQNIVVDDAFSL